MRRDQKFGLFLAGGSIISAVVLSQVLYLEEAGLRLELYILPALGFIAGALIFFTNFESVMGIQEIVDELPESVEEDIEAIKSGRITFPFVAVVATILCSFLQVYLIVEFRKWNAEWFGVSVLLISTFVVVVTAVLCFRSGWFQDRHYRLSEAIYLIPTVGFIVCVLLGAFYAEPKQFGELSPMEKDKLARSDQYYGSSRGSQVFYYMGSDSTSGSSIDFDCDGDECLGLLLILIVVICIVASALIPHFWILATMMLLTIMFMVAIREILYHQHRDYPRINY